MNRHADSIRARVVAMANGLSRSSDPVEFAVRLQALLSPVFPNVDRISINQNLSANFEGRSSPMILSYIRTYRVADDRVPAIECDSRRLDPSARVLAAIRRSGIDLDSYRAPATLTLELPTGSHAGVIFLWRRVDATEIPDEILALFRRLQPFLTFALSSAIARYQTVHRPYREARLRLGDIMSQAGLTVRQQEALHCRFNGLSARRTAEILNISVATVQRHLQAALKRLDAIMPGVDPLSFARTNRPVGQLEMPPTVEATP